MDNYKVFGQIANGAFGTVYRAQDRRTGEIVAIKRQNSGGRQNGVGSLILREVSILRKLSQRTYSSCITRFKEVFGRQGTTDVILVMEFVETNLRTFIETSTIPRETVKMLMYQLCKGVAFIHGTGVLHRDLKPENILINTQTRKLKIGDFGQARRYTLATDESYSPQRGDIRYRAPEILQGAVKYSTEVDIWSLGCTFAEIVNRQPLFDGRCVDSQIKSMKRILGDPSSSPSRRVKALEKAVSRLQGSRGLDLLDKMLCYDPSKRISAKEAMEHPYFDTVEKNLFESE